jgi:hypothetical protein
VLAHQRRLITVSFLSLIMSAIAPWPCSGQSAGRSATATDLSSARRLPVPNRKVETEAALEVLARLRTFRDCWNDPYMFLPSDSPRSENDALYVRCGTEYRLRFLELQDAVGRSIAVINDRTIRGQITEAGQVFKDLDTLRSVFDNRAYFLTRDVLVSDIFPIVRKYYIPYNETRISKVAVYQAMMPARRIHIDGLAALITGAPTDTNPTLTPTQADAAADDLAWSVVTRQGEAYDWYLGRYPHGRHVDAARDFVAHKDEIHAEREEQFAKTSVELKDLTHQALDAYVRANKPVLEFLVADRFPSRATYFARLQPQPLVLSFQIKEFEIRNIKVYAEMYQADEVYRATATVEYRSLKNEERSIHNTITYIKRNGTWKIVDWETP